MEISGVDIAVVEKGKDGKFVTIDDDVLDIARDLKKIDENLRLRWSEAGEYFVVYEMLPDGSEGLVLTSTELTPAILDRIREIGHSSYNYAKELDEHDKQVEREFDHGVSERIGPVAERLAHAVRKDLGVTNRAFFKKKD